MVLLKNFWDKRSINPSHTYIQTDPAPEHLVLQVYAGRNIIAVYGM